MFQIDHTTYQVSFLTLLNNPFFCAELLTVNSQKLLLGNCFLLGADDSASAKVICIHSSLSVVSKYPSIKCPAKMVTSRNCATCLFCAAM